jgi:hypothetical protein
MCISNLCRHFAICWMSCWYRRLALNPLQYSMFAVCSNSRQRNGQRLRFRQMPQITWRMIRFLLNLRLHALLVFIARITHISCVTRDGARSGRQGPLGRRCDAPATSSLFDPGVTTWFGRSGAEIPSGRSRCLRPIAVDGDCEWTACEPYIHTAWDPDVSACCTVPSSTSYRAPLAASFPVEIVQELLPQ